MLNLFSRYSIFINTCCCYCMFHDDAGKRHLTCMCAFISPNEYSFTSHIISFNAVTLFIFIYARITCVSSKAMMAEVCRVSHFLIFQEEKAVISHAMSFDASVDDRYFSNKLTEIKCVTLKPYAYIARILKTSFMQKKNRNILDTTRD